MKVLLDSCVWSGAAGPLRAAGFDVEACSDWPADPGDEVILAAALAQGRVLVTLDKDFGELAVVRGLPHSGIVRLVGFRAREQGEVAAQVITGHVDELAAGALITVSPNRLRIRPSG